MNPMGAPPQTSLTGIPSTSRLDKRERERYNGGAIASPNRLVIALDDPPLGMEQELAITDNTLTDHGRGTTPRIALTRSMRRAMAIAVGLSCSTGCSRTRAVDTVRDSSMFFETVAPSVALADGQQSILASPITAVELADGRILVADKSDRDIKVYSRNGERLTAIGRRGEGPNEFQALGGLVLKNGAIYALDSRRFLLNRFRADDFEALPAVRLNLTGGGVPTRLATGPRDQLLVPLFAIGMQNKDLVAVVDTNGTRLDGLLNRTKYFQDDPWLIQRAMPLAAASAGMTFTGLGLGPPEVHIRSADGTLIAAIDYSNIDLSSGTLVRSVKDLRGDKTAAEIAALPGRDVIHRQRFLYSLVGLPDSAALLVFRRFDATFGVDAAEPGEAAVLRRCNGQWSLSTAVPVPGLVAGVGHNGDILVPSYADASQNRYLLQRLQPRYRSTEACRVGTQ